MSYDFVKHHFKTNKEADFVLTKMQSIAMQYGYATVYDFEKLIGTLMLNEESRKYGLSYNDLKMATITYVTSPTEDGLYESYCFISFPEAHPLYNRASLWDANKPAEPLSITIYTEDVDDVANAIAEVFKYVYTIKDRPVHICLM